MHNAYGLRRRMVGIAVYKWLSIAINLCSHAHPTANTNYFRPSALDGGYR